MKLSMNAIWDETVVFIKREERLLGPLALATLFVGDAVASLAGAAMPQGQLPPLPMAIFVAALLWSMTGQLAILALTLRPGASVGEALRAGLANLWKVAVILLLFTGLFCLALIPLGIGLASAGYDTAALQAPGGLPRGATIYIGVVAGMLTIAALRLALTSGAMVGGDGPFAAMAASFRLTRGLTLRLLALLLIYLTVLLVLTGAVRFVFGSAFMLLARLIESPFTGLVLTVLATAAAATAVNVVACVFMALLYRAASKGI